MSKLNGKCYITKNGHIAPYCRCKYPKSPEMSTFNGNIHDLVTCTCGEEDCNQLCWEWDTERVSESCAINGRDVTFHPIYSQGTSFICGNKRLEPGKIHYWEIKTITIPFGTDMMFGIGTDKVDVDWYSHRFVSGLGNNDQSWGISYRGKKQHQALKLPFAPTISQACIIGIYLDLKRGFMELFVNRRSFGVVFYFLPTSPDVKLFPMVCSTSAKSAIRLLNSTTVDDNLQFKAFRKVVRQPALFKEVQQIPGLASLAKHYWFVEHITNYGGMRLYKNVPLEDEAVLPRRPRMSKQKAIPEEEYDPTPLMDGPNKIVTILKSRMNKKII